MDKMDLNAFGLDVLLLAALKAEVESRDIYGRLAGRVANAMLRDRLRFLAGEEEKHQAFVEATFARKFPGRAPVPPARTPVPLPEIKFDVAAVPLSEVFAAAMRAEEAAAAFYRGLADRFAGERETAEMISYLATMETGHYHILETERAHLLRFEDYAVSWPDIHVGP